MPPPKPPPTLPVANETADDVAIKEIEDKDKETKIANDKQLAQKAAEEAVGEHISGAPTKGSRSATRKSKSLKNINTQKKQREETFSKSFSLQDFDSDSSDSDGWKSFVLLLHLVPESKK